MSRHAQAGFTLIEVLVVLALLSLMAGLAGVALQRSSAEDGDSVTVQLAAARRRALEARRAITIELQVAGERYDATVFPDGSVAAPSALGVDPFTGRLHDRR